MSESDPYMMRKFDLNSSQDFAKSLVRCHQVLCFRSEEKTEGSMRIQSSGASRLRRINPSSSFRKFSAVSKFGLNLGGGMFPTE